MFKLKAYKQTFVHLFREDKQKQALQYCYDPEIGKGAAKLSVPKTTAVKLIQKYSQYFTGYKRS